MFVFYDGPTPPDGIFNNFTDIGADLNTAQTWDSYYDLVCSIDILCIIEKETDIRNIASR